VSERRSAAFAIFGHEVRECLGVVCDYLDRPPLEMEGFSPSVRDTVKDEDDVEVG
jgi:hypothetical protein